MCSAKITPRIFVGNAAFIFRVITATEGVVNRRGRGKKEATKEKDEGKEGEFQTCWKKTRAPELEAADLEMRLHAGKLFTADLLSFLFQHF